MRLILASLLLCAPAFGASRVYVGSFVQGAATISGFDFEPKALMVFGTKNTAAGSVAGANLAIGFCIPSGTAANIWSGSIDTNGATANTDTNRATSSTRCIDLYLETSAATKAAEMTLGACSPASCSLTWNTDDATARIYRYIAFGGSDVSAAVGTFAHPTTSGTVTVTPGFPATAVCFIESTTTVSASGNWNVAFGCQQGTSTTNATSIGSFVGDNAATSAAVSTQRNLGVSWLASPGAVYAEGSVTSTNATQFVYTATANSVAGASGSLIQYMALTGNWFGGHANQATAAAPTTTTLAPSFTPGFGLFYSYNAVASTALNSTQGRYSFGATDGTNSWSISSVIKDNATKQIASDTSGTSSVLNMMSEGADGANPTTQATIGSVTFTTNLATLNWTATDATAREFGFMLSDFQVNSGATPVRHRVIQ